MLQLLYLIRCVIIIIHSTEEIVCYMLQLLYLVQLKLYVAIYNCYTSYNGFLHGSNFNFRIYMLFRPGHRSLCKFLCRVFNKMYPILMLNLRSREI